MVADAYPLSPLEHRISVLREQLHATIRNAASLSGQERAQADALIANLANELDALVAERNILARDSG